MLKNVWIFIFQSFMKHLSYTLFARFICYFEMKKRSCIM
ncbi:hypothetical protein LMOSLCC2479_0939 [Listeria monocytogenes SLCC2479]|nr:hypothetical protein LM5578_1008 [Listeria monocytogenes 08-5578]ADB70806.1 hypothetical protein LM5923_0962 [Listeria monocytogenes 08-5923]CBY54275.1 hypothetical protein LMOSLCC2372_0940 [Listeria monocytogenes SLCC2372]CBY57210.1 hypothetical protein LMOSLCC2479_0939 [Listeria monocytogenes SLCC2479]CBY60113.1 hypothetical protein LMOSLCC7179_0907 [Listeria monocytogenes SLCC7179]